MNIIISTNKQRDFVNPLMADGLWWEKGSKAKDRNQMNNNSHLVSFQEIFAVHDLIPLVPVRAFGAVVHGCKSNMQF